MKKYLKIKKNLRIFASSARDFFTQRNVLIKSMEVVMRTVIILVLTMLVVFSCQKQNKEEVLQQFIEQHVAKIKPLETAAKEAYWEAATTGKQEAYKKSAELELKIRKIYSNRQEFKFLKELKESKKIKEPLLKRQLQILYNRYLQNQIDSTLMRQMVELSSQIEEKFSTFRPELNGKKVTNNEILEILKNETNNAKRKAAWEASKQVGAVVADDIVKLVKLRNQAAQSLGFENYHTMSLEFSEQRVKQIDRIMWDVAEFTLEPFYNAKKVLDQLLAQKYHISVQEIRP